MLIPKLLFHLLFACCSCFCCAGLASAQGPENTLVVVNADSQDSLAVANLYVQLRDIPATNVVYLNNVPGHKSSAESCTSVAFKKSILDPILDAMSSRGIEKQIDCVAYSAGFPTRIDIQPQVDFQRRQQSQGPNKFSWASITSLTYFHRNAFSKNPNFFALECQSLFQPEAIEDPVQSVFWRRSDSI